MGFAQPRQRAIPVAAGGGDPTKGEIVADHPAARHEIAVVAGQHGRDQRPLFQPVLQGPVIVARESMDLAQPGIAVLDLDLHVAVAGP